MADAAKLSGATIADLLAIPEEHRRHELIDGVLVEKEAASGRYGGAQVRIARRLGPYDRRPGGRSPGGWWFATEAEIQLAETQVFRPDVAGWRRERMRELPSEVPITLRPDWICEILSTNKRNDLIKKKRAYHLHQVGHYWLVDPIEETSPTAMLRSPLGQPGMSQGQSRSSSAHGQPRRRGYALLIDPSRTLPQGHDRSLTR